MKKKSSDIGIRYDRIAQSYDFWDSIPERLFYSSWRHHLWNKVTPGRILEIGVGTGKNIRFYPPGAQVTAIDISPKMLEKAVKRATMRPDVPIELGMMDLSQLSFDDNIFDAVVGSFVFTVLPDPFRALQEIKRICQPGGSLLLLEYTRSDNKLIALLQDMMTPLTHAVYRARINRDIVTLVAQSAFKIISVEEIGDGIVKLIHAVLPHRD